mmetsp:Transcript_2951/g.8525  ORF Transcript_2951/g.8525 Transcript_2951/m.8525 type:complete len:533 (-) Transcript_2951:1758-3356(-)
MPAEAVHVQAVRPRMVEMVAVEHDHRVLEGVADLRLEVTRDGEAHDCLDELFPRHHVFGVHQRKRLEAPLRHATLVAHVRARGRFEDEVRHVERAVLVDDVRAHAEFGELGHRDGERIPRAARCVGVEDLHDLEVGLEQRLEDGRDVVCLGHVLDHRDDVALAAVRQESTANGGVERVVRLPDADVIIEAMRVVLLVAAAEARRLQRPPGVVPHQPPAHRAGARHRRRVNVGRVGCQDREDIEVAHRRGVDVVREPHDRVVLLLLLARLAPAPPRGFQDLCAAPHRRQLGDRRRTPRHRNRRHQRRRFRRRFLLRLLLVAHSAQMAIANADGLPSKEQRILAVQRLLALVGLHLALLLLQLAPNLQELSLEETASHVPAHGSMPCPPTGSAAISAGAPCAVILPPLPLRRRLRNSTPYQAARVVREVGHDRELRVLHVVPRRHVRAIAVLGVHRVVAHADLEVEGYFPWRHHPPDGVDVVAPVKLHRLLLLHQVHQSRRVRRAVEVEVQRDGTHVVDVVEVLAVGVVHEGLL